MLLALIAAVAVQASGSEELLLQSFERACGRLDQIELMEQRIIANDWERFTPTSGSDLARLVEAIGVAPSPQFQIDTRTYRRTGAGPISVLISEVVAPDGSRSIECKSLAPVAAPPEIATLTRWAGRQPTDSRDENGTTLWNWTPGVHSDAQVTAILYVPSEVRPQFPNFGLSVTAIRFPQ